MRATASMTISGRGKMFSRQGRKATRQRRLLSILLHKKTCKPTSYFSALSHQQGALFLVPEVASLEYCACHIPLALQAREAIDLTARLSAAAWRGGHVLSRRKVRSLQPLLHVLKQWILFYKKYRRCQLSPASQLSERICKWPLLCDGTCLARVASET